ncbi:hypothetical protein L9F63_023097, partial [Diploptera punctata]
GMHLCLHPANNTVYKHVCDTQYYADSPVLPVEFFGRLYQIPLLRQSTSISIEHDFLNGVVT